MGRIRQEEGEKQRGMKERGGEAGQSRHRRGGARTRKEAERRKKWRQAGGGWGRGGGDAEEAEGRGEKKREGVDLGVSLRPGILDRLPLLVGHSRKRQNKRGALGV